MLAVHTTISVLPYRCITYLAQGEEIEVIDTVPALPSISYFALYHEGSRLKLLEAMAIRLAEAADFTRPFFV
ncbi:hypothetical protein [Kushneria aurantia]|uniref:LysR substrate-binding domain-containing protein n=1 Tax=Kushneria aurantia TaxID=504092 RepID=A0ABV6G021_9GAMM|nr:hypothetical protein [Kushneria aurantia]